ncbi:MAG: division/cell wall cluster transcriptional repressor MraZ, partial [Alphaproteobacteria bacterium]|nr:division/cell wall cluster transcriptional repressor MraZ [Alphaproteobacteria bacterium]
SKPVAGERFFLFPSPTHAALEACSLSFMARVQQSIAATTTIFSQEENQISWLFAEARETQMDSTGRFVLPDDLLAFAQLPLGLPIYFVGYGNRFLIWNEANVKEFKKTQTPPRNLKLIDQRG